MPQHALRTTLVAALAVGTLTLLTGCGGAGDKGGAGPASAAGGGDATTTTTGGAAQLTVPDGVDDATKKEYVMENAIAVCMKKKGFTYTPHVSTTDAKAVDPVDGEDYAAAKTFRQKYGFGIYAASVYPDDPAVSSRTGGKGTASVEDNDEQGLTPAEKKAYDTALQGPPAAGKAEEKIGGCMAEAHTKAYGPDLSPAAEKAQENARNEKNRENGQALNGDPQLVQLAQQFAGCLTGQGITVTTTQPTGMADMVRLNLARAIPEHHTMSKEDALPLLAKDIDVALKDLDCGKDFRAAYYPKLKANPYFEVDG